jgi:hypothetical protein
MVGFYRSRIIHSHLFSQVKAFQDLGDPHQAPFRWFPGFQTDKWQSSSLVVRISPGRTCLLDYSVLGRPYETAIAEISS